MSAYSYDSNDIQLSLTGIPIAGFGDNKITLSMNNDRTSLVEGVDGENIFATSNKKAGTLSFDLLYGTEYDALLDQLSTWGGFFLVSFIHKKSFKFISTFGKVMTQPDVALGETPENRTWVIAINNASLQVKDVANDLSSNIDINFTPPSAG